jgi:Fic family protein
MDTLAARDHRRAKRLTDLLDSIHAELRTRLDELRSLVREYERLQEAEAALADGSPTSGKRASQPKRGGSQARQGDGRRGAARRTRSRRRSNSSAEREVNREKVVALVRQRPGITKAELKNAAGLSSAGVAQNLRRMLDRGEVHEEALPGGATGYRIADGRTAPSASGREGKTGQ